MDREEKGGEEGGKGCSALGIGEYLTKTTYTFSFDYEAVTLAGFRRLRNYCIVVLPRNRYILSLKMNEWCVVRL